MAKRKRENRPDIYAKWIKEGYGQGIGKEYKPWITVHDFPSNGFISRAPGWKSNQVCHFCIKRVEILLLT